MTSDKERQEISVLGRLFCLEAFLFLMGIACLISGFVTGAAMQLFWGAMIMTGSVILHFVKKKDWKKHWEEQEMMRQMMQEHRERARKEKETNDAGKE